MKDEYGPEIILGMALVLLLVMGAPAIREQAFTDGYCAALGGERIARYTCDVDGKVVNV